MMRSFRFRCLLMAIAAFTSFSAESLQAQVKPFKIRGAGIAPDGLPLPGQPMRSHWIVGNATHLGRHWGLGAVMTDSADLSQLPGGPITGEFGSAVPFVFVGANGDQLACHYGRTDFGAIVPGMFELTVIDVLPTGDLVVKALWIAEFVVQTDLCTGKFAGATGSWIMIARSGPFVLGSSEPLFYWWHGKGQLKFAQGQ